MESKILILKEFKCEEFPSIHFDVMDDIIKQSSEKLIKQREDQIIERLRLLGFEFETRELLGEFAKTRLTIVTHNSNSLEKSLYIDFESEARILVATWWETINISDLPDDQGRFTITFGINPVI